MFNVVKVVGFFAEQEAGGSAAAAAPLRVHGGNAVPLSANIPALCVKQRCDPDHWIFFHKHPQSSPSPEPSPTPLSILSFAPIVGERKKGGGGGRGTERKRLLVKKRN